MKVDKDKPGTWVAYKESACRSCYGTCCTMPVEVKIEDLLGLEIITEDDFEMSRRKLAKRLQREGIVKSYRESTELFMLESRPNGDCIYLHPTTRLCTTYDKRPSVCRRFPAAAGNRIGFCPKLPKTT